MLKTLALASLLSLAYAQSSASAAGWGSGTASSSASATTSPSTPTGSSSGSGTASPSATGAANPLVPTGISSGCTTFLNTLNSDSTIAGCLGALTNATSVFAPGSNGTASSAAITTALTNLCSPSVDNVCPENAVRSQLTSFFSSCSTELTSNINNDVLKIYDVLYTLLPMRTSACTKGDDGSWCAMAPTTTTREVSEDVAGEGSSLSVSQLLALLYEDNGALKRRDVSTPAIVPNTTTFQDTYLPFIFYKPSLDATNLCTSCARQVLTSYINFESDIPYGPGLSNSPILSGQPALYSAVQDKCPAGFLNSAVQAAGGLGKGSSNGIFGSVSPAVPAASSESKMALAAAMGALTLAVSFAL